MAIRTKALKDQARDAQSASQLCALGCGHPKVQHRELSREDPAYAPLHFHCSNCECVRVVE